MRVAMIPAVEEQDKADILRPAARSIGRTERTIRPSGRAKVGRSTMPGQWRARRSHEPALAGEGEIKSDNVTVVIEQDDVVGQRREPARRNAERGFAGTRPPDEQCASARPAHRGCVQGDSQSAHRSTSSMIEALKQKGELAIPQTRNIRACRARRNSPCRDQHARTAKCLRPQRQKVSRQCCFSRLTTRPTDKAMRKPAMRTR